ncbi:hypothetical protein FSP39_004547 [Pinctada imbricata]|uniref:Uncharacterized protein n=1 Tax=Pinctada imbricata TaxID=66713 RepID=A0AA88XP06_PINIB|nr:hypothetical protein FSP39_004547 [Pinctada imbricata]
MSSQNGQTDFDAFLYIIVVLSFYATSMVLLMIKYIRREEEEISLDHYYTEFVEREHFHDIRNRNKMLVQLIAKDQRVEKMIQSGQNIKNFMFGRRENDLSLKILPESTRLSVDAVPDGAIVSTKTFTDQKEKVEPGGRHEVRMTLETDL